MPGAEPADEEAAEADSNIIDARPQINERLERERKAKAQNEVERVKSGQQKIKKATGTPETAGKTGDNAAGGALGSVGGSPEDRKEAAKNIAKEEAKQYAKRLAAQAGAAIKKWALEAVAAIGWPIWAIIGGVLIVVIIVVVIFVLFSFDGQGGKGPGEFPETALQQQQSNFLLAISGDKIAQDTAIKEVIDSELARYDRIKTNADTHSPELSAGIAAKKTELDSKLMAILVEQAVERRKILRDELQTGMNAFEATLPFGSWIVALAEERVGQPNLQFCSITDAAAKVACASFTSTVMYLSGVPNPIEAGVDGIWRRPFYQTIADRPAVKSTDYYQQNVSKLRPGDIIFWGDGACSPEGSVLFDHVGFYIGNDEAIDTSSSEEKVLKRPAASRDDCRVFNGAKRYGR